MIYDRQSFFSHGLNTNETRILKSAAKNQKLPNDIQALWFVCQCFGFGVRELNWMLEAKRKFNPQPYKHFPKNFSGTILQRGKTDPNKKYEPLRIILREALYDRIRRQNGKPLWSFTGKLTDELVFPLLFLYENLLPKLYVEGVSTPDALWVLVENVFVPTVFVKLVQEWRSGLGNEFLDEVCWYLPIRKHGQVEKPLPRVLNYWMRVAGFQTAYQVAKAAGQESLKRKIDRWLKGEITPSPPDLHKLVDKFTTEVSWLDEPDSWKARFTLACAMQNVCDRMDEYFNPVQKNSSLALIKMIQRISKERKDARKLILGVKELNHLLDAKRKKADEQ